MVTLDEVKTAKVKRGKIAETVFLAAACAGLIFFAAAYPVTRAKNLHNFTVAVCILSAVLVGAGAAGAAACDLKYGRLSDRIIRHYIIGVCLEKPELLHPERDSLTFTICSEGLTFTLGANGYKEKLIFDFSPFKRLSPMKKSAIADEIGLRLIVTFCTLYGRGGQYKDVAYRYEGAKKGKGVPVIVGGTPDKKSYKLYLKNR